MGRDCLLIILYCDVFSFTFTEYLLNRTEPVLKSLNNLQTSYTEYSADKEGE